MSAYFPGIADVKALFGVAIAATGMVWAGRLLLGRRVAPEIGLVAGWGALCIVFTAWAVCTPFTLYAPAAAGFLAALIGCRTQGQINGSIWRVALLTLPLWSVMLAARPSQVDTWLNLLPNQAFLVDHALLPRDGGPAQYSLLPDAPYNTQFAAFAASLISGGLAANAMALFNILLMCAAALKLARVAAGRDGLHDPLPLPWWACAIGLLLAAPLNLGFVPRVFFSAYGEAPTAVALMFAVALSADLLDVERRRAPIRAAWAGVALSLAALTGIKQSSPGLLLPLSAGLLGIGFIQPGLRRARWCALVAGGTAPSFALLALWRWHVASDHGVGELKMLPLDGWHWALLPGILRAVGAAVIEKPAYFLAMTAVLAACVMRRRDRDRMAAVLWLAGVLILAFPVFLLFTYVAHFPPNWALHAHSFFRYMSQLSLVVALALAHWLRPGIAAWFAARSRSARRRMSAGAVGAVALLPLALAPVLRFDLDAPQPVLWDLAHRIAPYLRDGDRVALVIPGDSDDATGSFLRGTLLFTAPRHKNLLFRSETGEGQAALDDAAVWGADRVLVTCSRAAVGPLEPGRSGLLGHDIKGWHRLATWPLPEALASKHFSAMLPHAPLCGTDQPPQ